MKHRALCASPDVDPSLWFAGPEAVGEAKAICTACPAKAECLELALAWHPVEGIWGGTTIGERTRALDERSAALPTALTTAGARR